MNPFTWGYRLLYGSVPAQFQSGYGLEASVSRLQAATERTVFTKGLKQAAVGKVSAQRVRLQRLIPFVGNSFKPFFVGRFEQRGDGVWLVGRFTMLPLIKVFITLWMAAALLIGTGFAWRASQSDPLLCLIPFAFVGLALAFVRFGQWLSRNDIAWLSAVIASALAAPVAGAEPPILPQTSSKMIIAIVAAAVGGVGLMGGLFFSIDHRIQESPSYLAARAFLATSPAVRAEFGEIKAIRYTHNFHIQAGGSAGTPDRVRITFAIVGSTEAADVQLSYSYRSDLSRFTAEHLWVLGEHAHEVALP